MSSYEFGTSIPRVSEITDNASMALALIPKHHSEIHDSQTDFSEEDMDSTVVTSSRLQISGAPYSDTRPFTDMDLAGNMLYHYLQYPFDHEYDLLSLRKLNRLSARRELPYPRDLLMSMVKAQSRMKAVIVPKAGSSTLSIPAPWSRNSFVCTEENNRITPFINKLGTTMELALCNELALMKFRDAVAKHFPALTQGMETWDIEAQWVKAKGDIRGVSRLAYWVEDDGITLSAWMPGTYNQMVVRVAAQLVAPGEYKIDADGDLVSTPEFCRQI